MTLKKRLAMATAGALLLSAVPMAAPAIAQISASVVAFPRGQDTTTISGTITGRQVRDYRVRVAPGQALSVRLSGARPSVYFNVMAPGSNGEAIFIGSTSGNAYSARLRAPGVYTIRVYQMRAAGRRGVSSNYSLRVSVTGTATADRPGAGGQVGSIAGIQGMNAIRAFDVLRSRGFESVDSITGGNTLYGIYYYRPTRLCVQTTSANTTIVDIRDIRRHPKCR